MTNLRRLVILWILRCFLFFLAFFLVASPVAIRFYKWKSYQVNKISETTLNCFSVCTAVFTVCILGPCWHRDTAVSDVRCSRHRNRMQVCDDRIMNSGEKWLMQTRKLSFVVYYKGCVSNSTLQ